MKRCRTCGRVKPRSEYYRHRTGQLLARCKSCEVKRAHEWAKQNRDKVRRSNDRAVMKFRYGITLEAYDQMIKAQKNRCAMCGDKEHHKRRLSVDHDHRTGKIRGLLCNYCNVRLGVVENKKLLVLAENYLRRTT